MIDKRKNVVFDDTPRQCQECGGKYVFQGAGRYVCENCGHETYDDFGKIKAFIDEHGPTPGIVIAEATGVSIAKINRFLRQGRIEIPDGSGQYIPCERCGEPIRYGRFCPACAAFLTKNLSAVLTNADVGEKPKKTMQGKMHTESFLKRGDRK